tara:strand:- start:312 stop:587 length:276 start_codon:yes stop_codon:yes gene_type:complete
MNITMPSQLPKYAQTQLLRGLFGNHKPKHIDKPNIFYFCGFSNSKYTDEYYRERDTMRPTEIVYCDICECGCQFKNIMKHCNSSTHRHFME